MRLERSALSCVIVLGLLGTVLRHEGWAADLATSGVCMREGQKLVGVSPVLIGKSVRQPKKVRNVTPKYPELPLGTTGSGRWIGEVLLDVRGKIVAVWTIHEADLTPPFPAFNQAIVDAIRRWEFEPLMVNERATPACTTVAVMIHWS